MELALVVVGGALVALVVVDALWTVLWSGMGGGPVTTTLTAGMRRLVSAAAKGRRRFLSVGGPLALVLVIGTWTMGLLVGFSLVVQAMPDGVRHSATGAPADATERAYFVGYTLFTLGNGDFVPYGDGARLLTIVMNLLGMFLVTLSVTYVLPVVAASVSSRAMASNALSLGGTPSEVVVAAWDGRRIDLQHQLRELSSELGTLAHQHLAYPVLHLFHATDRSASGPLAVALLDGTLDLLDVVDPEVAPHEPARRQLRSSIERYVTTFGSHVTGGSDVPPPPSLDELRDAGIPVRGEQHLDEVLEERRSHRQGIASLLAANGLEAPTARDERSDDDRAGA